MKRRFIKIFRRCTFLPLLIAAAILFVPRIAGILLPLPVFGSFPEWNLVLVNPEHRLPKSDAPALTELWNGERVDTRIYPALQEMFDKMRAQGVYPVVASGYRTTEEQQALMDNKIETLIAQGNSRAEAKTEALKWVAAAGYSEHQTGLAVDINADGVHSTGQQVYDWLAKNASAYGFIQRYPEDKTDITGTHYEPWHYRYVGKEAAAAIARQGVCLEEYLNGAP